MTVSLVNEDSGTSVEIAELSGRWHFAVTVDNVTLVGWRGTLREAANAVNAHIVACDADDDLTLCTVCNGLRVCPDCDGLGFSESWEDRSGGPGLEHYTVETFKSCCDGPCGPCSGTGFNI